MKLNRKLVLVLALVLSVAMATGGTLAYLTDRDSAANVFTMGNVKIKLNEEFEQGVKLLPGQEVTKKPTITNTGSEDAYVWLTVAYPKAFTGIEDEYSTEDVPSYCETWQLHGGRFNGENTMWTELESKKEDETEGRIVRTFLYNAPLAAGGSTDANPLFDQIGLCYHIDITPEGDMYHVVNGNAVSLNWNINTNGNPVVYVSAYAIQAQEFDSAEKAFNAYNTQWGDNGTEWASTTIEPDTAWYTNNPDAVSFEISTAAELFGFAKLVNEGTTNFNGKTINLTADINLLNQEWTPIGQTGNALKQFHGTFDGGEHTIKNLKISDATTSENHQYGTGLFGWLAYEGNYDAACIKNLTVDHATVDASHYAGVIVGYVEVGTVDNCKVTNSSVIDTHKDENRCGDKAGGAVGYVNPAYEAYVKGCTVADTKVAAARDAGQVVGCSTDAIRVINCTVSNVVVSATDGCTDTKSGQNINNSIIGR